jgi:hypothetical protein
MTANAFYRDVTGGDGCDYQYASGPNARLIHHQQPVARMAMQTPPLSYTSGQDQPADSSSEQATQPKASTSPLEGIALKQLDGREVGGYSLNPAKKVKWSQLATDKKVSRVCPFGN